MKIEKTLVIIKPDAVNRSLIGQIISRFERKGLKIVGLKTILLDDAILDEHYSHLSDKAFFPRLKDFMKQSPSIVMVLEGLNAVEVVRLAAGETHGAKALPGTIRGDFSISTQSNVIHASEDQKAAESEIKRFFKEDELFVYERMDYQILYADDERE